MTTLTVGLELPAPFDAASRGAWVEYGKRKLTLFITEPGRFARNDFTTLYIEVVERLPYKGEPLYVHGHRTEARNGHARRPITDAAARAATEALLPPIQRYGFSRAWADAYAARCAKEAEGSAWEVARAQAEASWWAQQRDLSQMMADGLLELRPTAETLAVETRLNRDDLRRLHITRLASYGQQPYHERIAAEALLGDEVVGYMTNEGHLVPPDDVLAATSGPRGALPT